LALRDGPRTRAKQNQIIQNGRRGAAAAIIPSSRVAHPVAVLVEHLREQKNLIILDTCEHIVEPVATLAEVLLGACPTLQLIVTSREALRAIGEWTHRLPSLTFPDEGRAVSESDVAAYSAISLFVKRVRSSTRYELRGQDLPLISEICRRLDGIPLALEFAAARVADLGLREIAARLDDRFTLGAAHSRSRPRIAASQGAIRRPQAQRRLRSSTA